MATGKPRWMCWLAGLNVIELDDGDGYDCDTYQKGLLGRGAAAGPESAEDTRGAPVRCVERLDVIASN